VVIDKKLSVIHRLA